MNIVLLGPPGIGKGTAANKLSKKLSIPHIATGDMLRENISNKTDLGIKVKEYMDKGLLVPDELVIEMVIERVKHDDSKNGFILDGFPRTINQAEAISDKVKIDRVINIQASDDIIIERISKRRVCPKCKAIYHLEFIKPKKEGICDKCESELIIRDDDKPESVKKRLVVYREQTKPLIDYYIKKGILKNADGSGTPKDEFDSIADAAS